MERYAIIGGPCSGKSTLIAQLKEKGHPVLEEIARKVLSERKDRRLDEEEQITRQKLIFLNQLKEESRLRSSYAFLDRGILDSLAYQNYLLGEVFPDNFQEAKKIPRYKEIFLLDRLPFENDGLRVESGDDEAQRIHECIVNEYRSFGYRPVPVPVMSSISERADFILNYTGRKND